MAKVLVIDDSQFQRRRIKALVMAMGHDAVEAGNGEEGLKMVRSEQPDCITLDLLMPEMDGPTFLSNLRSEGITIPVVVFTADIQEDTRRRVLELGASAFVNKPPKEDELGTAIDRCLGVQAGEGE